MPTLLETAAELDKMLNTGWAGTTPIAVDNIIVKETEGQAYLETKFIPYITTNVNISASSQKRKRTEGVLFIAIKTPLSKGIGLAYSYADTIKDIMDNKNPLPNLFTQVSSIERIGDSRDGWFNLICRVPFISDDV